MTIKTLLKEKQKDAMKQRDKTALQTVRLILTEMQYEEIKKGVNDLSDPDTISVLKRELKKRQEEMEFANQSGRAELIDKLKLEIQLIEGFLPKQLSREDLLKIVQNLKSESPEMNMGIIMKILKERYSGQYDGKLASEVAKEMMERGL